MNTLFNDGSTVPAAYVTVGRQRVKQYGNSVYLNNGNEFEIELFNPTTTKVLAKLELNGVSLGSGIVLRPGERVFLERYLNEAKRFLFETYEVDGNNPGVQKAIANNGQVSVKFYSEYINYGITLTGGSSWTYGWPTWGTTSVTSGLNNPTYTSSNIQPIGKRYKSNMKSSIKSAGLNDVNHVYSCNNLSNSIGSKNFDGMAGGADAMGFFNMSSDIEFASAAPAAVAPIETGRIEKGSNSNQNFTYDSTTFNTWYSWSSEWKILPVSQKPVVQEDLKVYCTKCGARRRKPSDNFCAKCGTKF